MSIITTPRNKIEVELKEFITGKEAKEIKAPIKNVEFDVNEKGQTSKTLNFGKLQEKSIEIAVKTIVLKVGDGKETDVWAVIENMPNDDYEFILEKVDKVVRGVDFTKPVLKQEDGIVSEK